MTVSLAHPFHRRRTGNQKLRDSTQFRGLGNQSDLRERAGHQVFLRLVRFGVAVELHGTHLKVFMRSND